MAEPLKKEFSSQGYNIVTEMDDGEGLEQLSYDTTAAQDILKIKYRPVEESLVEMAKSMIKTGLIKPPKK